MNQSIRFVDKQRSDFFAVVKARTEEYFKTNKISKYANVLMYFKTFFFLGGAILCYALIISGAFSLGAAFLLAVLLGMFKAFIGFNICHDAIHGAYSSKKIVNDTLGLVFNLIGANASVWRVTHNIVHHTYTNIPGHDEDIEVAPGLIRLSPLEPYKPVMRFQHLYAFPLYGLASLSWVFRKDYLKFFKKYIGHYDNSKHDFADYFNLFFFKALYYTLFIALPLSLTELTIGQFLLGFVCMHIAEGLVLGLVFQLAHVVECTEFPIPNTEGNIEEAWAVHQLRTTANFATDSFLTNFFCGGLNFQVEHHLFPKICHVHYTALSKIVAQTAAEFGLPYNNNPTFLGAMRSHYRMLKLFGREDFRFTDAENSMPQNVASN